MPMRPMERRTVITPTKRIITGDIKKVLPNGTVQLSKTERNAAEAKRREYNAMATKRRAEKAKEEQEKHPNRKPKVFTPDDS